MAFLISDAMDDVLQSTMATDQHGRFSFSYPQMANVELES